MKLKYIFLLLLATRLTAVNDTVKPSALKMPGSIHREAANAVTFIEPNNQTKPESSLDKESESITETYTQHRLTKEEPRELETSQSVDTVDTSASIINTNKINSPETQVTLLIKSNGLTEYNNQSTASTNNNAHIQVNHEVPDIGEQPAFTNYVLNNMRDLIKNLTSKTLSSSEPTIPSEELNVLSANTEELFEGLCDPAIITCRTNQKKNINPETKKQAFKKLTELKPLFIQIYDTIQQAPENPEKQSTLRLLLQAFYGVEINTTHLDSAEQALKPLQDKPNENIQEVVSSYQKLLNDLNDPDILTYRSANQTDIIKSQAKDKLETLTPLFITVYDKLELTIQKDLAEDDKISCDQLKECLNSLTQQFYGTNISDLKVVPESKLEWRSAIETAKNSLNTVQNSLKKIKYSKKEELAALSKKLNSIASSIERVSTPTSRLRLLASLKLALEKIGLTQNKLKEKIEATKVKLPSMSSQILKSMFQTDLDVQKELALAADQTGVALLSKLPNTSAPENQISTAEAVQDLAKKIKKQADDLVELISTISPRAMAS